MWCGPTAVARLTGWSRDQVWVHVRALRERRGDRMTDKPYGGVAYTDLLNALDRAGYVAELVFTNRRMRYGDFAKRIARSGRWLVMQRRHTFAHFGGEQIHPTTANAVIIGAYRVRRRPKSDPVGVLREK